MVERGGRLVVTVVTALALSACGHDGSPATGAGGDAGSPPTDARPMATDADADADADPAIDCAEVGSDAAEAGKWREAGTDGVRSESGVASLCGVSTGCGTWPPMTPIPYRGASIAGSDLNGDDRPAVV